MRDEPAKDTRSDILSQVSMEDGGCADCKWWKVCYGHCAASGFGGDWRLRSKHCGAFMVLYEHIANKLEGLFPKIDLVTNHPDNEYNQIGQKIVQRTFAGLTGACVDKGKQVPPGEGWQPVGHHDGIEHLDGDMRHLDSDAGVGGHTDGIEHLDGDTRHLDSGGG